MAWFGIPLKWHGFDHRFQFAPDFMQERLTHKIQCCQSGNH